jgi:hypothetical protein
MNIKFTAFGINDCVLAFYFYSQIYTILITNLQSEFSQLQINQSILKKIISLAKLKNKKLCKTTTKTILKENSDY